MSALGFYSSVELTSVPWRRGSFLVGKILINSRILWDPFLVEILSIRVNYRAQDISLYTHSWRPSKAMLVPSQVSFTPSISFYQLLIPYSILVVSYKCRQLGGEVVVFTMSSFSPLNAQHG